MLASFIEGSLVHTVHTSLGNPETLHNHLNNYIATVHFLIWGNWWASKGKIASYCSKYNTFHRTMHTTDTCKYVMCTWEGRVLGVRLAHALALHFPIKSAFPCTGPTYVCAEAGLLVMLQTWYFVLMGPACVTSTFRPEGKMLAILSTSGRLKGWTWYHH